MNEAEPEYRSAVEALQPAERAIATIDRADVAARAAATQVVTAAAARVRDANAAMKVETTRKNLDGLGNSPFFIACGERLDAATLAQLSERALAIQVEREQAAAARRAAKAASAIVPEPAKPPRRRQRRAPGRCGGGPRGPEILVRRPYVAGDRP